MQTDIVTAASYNPAQLAELNQQYAHSTKQYIAAVKGLAQAATSAAVAVQHDIRQLAVVVTEFTTRYPDLIDLMPDVPGVALSALGGVPYDRLVEYRTTLLTVIKQLELITTARVAVPEPGLVVGLGRVGALRGKVITVDSTYVPPPIVWCKSCRITPVVAGGCKTCSWVPGVFATPPLGTPIAATGIRLVSGSTGPPPPKRVKLSFTK